MSNWNCTVVRSEYYSTNSPCSIYEKNGNLVWAQSAQCVSDSCSLTVFTNGTVKEDPVKVGTGSWCVNSFSANSPAPIIGGVCLPAVPSALRLYDSFYSPTAASIAIYEETDSTCSGSAASVGIAIFKTCLPLPYSSDYFMLSLDVLDNIYLLQYSDLFCGNLVSTTKASPDSPCINSMELTVANTTNQGFEVNTIVSGQNVTQSISYHPTYTTCADSEPAKCYTDGADFNLTTYSLEVFGSQPFFIQIYYIQSLNQDCSAGVDYETAYPLYQCLDGFFNWLMNSNTVLVTSSYNDDDCQGSPNVAMQIPVNSCSSGLSLAVYNLDALSSVVANANGLLLVPASGFTSYSAGGSGSGKSSTLYIVVGVLGGLVLVAGVVYAGFRKYYSNKKKLASEGLGGNELDVYSSSI